MSPPHSGKKARRGTSITILKKYMEKQPKSFHKTRHFRLSDDTFSSLEKLKIQNRGTWNYFFINLLKKYGKNPVQNKLCPGSQKTDL